MFCSSAVQSSYSHYFLKWISIDSIHLAQRASHHFISNPSYNVSHYTDNLRVIWIYTSCGNLSNDKNHTFKTWFDNMQWNANFYLMICRKYFVVPSEFEVWKTSSVKLYNHHHHQVWKIFSLQQEPSFYAQNLKGPEFGNKLSNMTTVTAIYKISTECY